MISEKLIRGVQALLARFGIFARVGYKADARGEPARTVGAADPERRRPADLRRRDRLHRPAQGGQARARPSTCRAAVRSGVKRLEIARIEPLGAMEVYDIQTESGEYLSGSLRVHNCFILVRRRHDGLDPQLVPGGGPDLQGRLRRRPQPVPDPVVQGAAVLRRHRVRAGVFMRGADASAGTIKSGGATRRAAKMVVLDVDHPDIEEFVETKAREEDKIRALRDAGFDMDLGGNDITSVQYQNANNSVRVTDEFMRAVEEGGEFGLRARTDRRGDRDRRRQRAVRARSRRRRGSAPTRASSTTTPSTTGTPARRPAGSPRRTRAREYMQPGQLARATWRR